MLAIGFFVSSLVIVPRALLEKKLSFKKIAMVETIAIIVSGIIAISLAFTGYGIWSLIVQRVCLGVFMTALIWGSARWRPRFIFELEKIKELYRYSINNIGCMATYYWSSSIESLFIGRFLGPARLGVYNRALNLMRLPTSQIDTVLQRVMFPVLSKMQNDSQEIKKIFLQSMGAISLVVSPIMLGLIVTAKPFILTVYGKKWVEVIPILQILSFIGLLISFMAPTRLIYMARGKTDLLLKWRLVSSFVLITSKCIGAFMGSLQTLAISYAIANIVLLYPCIMIAGKLIKLTFTEVMLKVVGPLGSALGMAILLKLVESFLPQRLADGNVLIINILFGGIFYGTILHLFNVPEYTKARELVIEKWQLFLSRKRAAVAG